MSVVGRAYVNVRAVTRQVEPDIQRGVDDALDRVSAKVSDRGGAGAKLGESLGEGVDKSKLDEKINEKVDRSVKSNDIDRAGRDLGQHLGEGLLKDGAITAAIKKAVRAAIPSADKDGEDEGRESGKGFVRGFLGAIGRIAVNPMMWIVAAIPPAIEQGFTLISNAAAGAVAIAETLGPTIAAGAASGALAMGTLLTTVGAVMIAFKTKSPELTQFKASLGDIGDEVHVLGRTIQRELFPALSETAHRIDAAIGPALRHGLNLTADAVAGVSLKLAHLTELKFFQRDVATIMEGNAVALSNFGSAGVKGFGIITQLGAAASPMFERLSRSANSFMSGLFDETRIAAGSGKLEKFFERAGHLAGQWASAVGNVSAGLFNIFSAGSRLGGSLLGDLDKVTQRFRDWSESANGQNSIGEWFKQAQPVLHSLGGLVGALGRAMGSLSGGTERVVGTLDALSSGLPGLAKVIGALSGGFADLLGQIAPVIGALGVRLAPAVGDAAKNIADHLGPALSDLAGPLGDAVESALSLVDNLTPLVTLAGKVLGPALDVVSYALEGVNAALDALPDPVAGLVLSLAGLRVAWALLARSAANNADGMLAKISTNYAAIKAKNVALETSFAGVKAAGSTMVGILGGGLGLALGAASIAFGIFADKQAKAKEEADALTAAYDEQTGALTELGRAQLNKKLQDKGVFDDADRLGISYQLITDAILGNKDAQQQLNETLAGYDPVMGATQTSAENLRKSFSEQETQTILADQAAYRLSQTVGGLTPQYTEAASKAEQLARANSRNSGSFDDTRLATGRYIKQNKELIGSADRSESALRGLSKAILSVNDAAVKGLEAQISFRQSIDDARKAFAKSKDTLDLQKQAGRDNVSALLDVASAAEKVTGSVKHQQAAMKEARDEVYKLAQAKTDDDDKAKKLTDRIFNLSREYGKVPKNVQTDVNSPTIDGQILKAKQLRDILEGINGSTYSYNVQQGIVLGPPVPAGSAPGQHVNAPGAGTAPDTPKRASTNPGGTLSAPTGGGGGGVNFNGNISVQASDYRDFVRQLGQKTRATSLSGYGGSGVNL